MLASLSREYTTVLFHSSCHQQFCLNLVTGRLQRLSHSQSSKPYDELLYSDIRGGILADEMGIGKTLEVLGLILAHPRTSSPLAPRGDMRDHTLQDTISSDSPPPNVHMSCICDNNVNDSNVDTSAVAICTACAEWIHPSCMGGEALFNAGGRKCLHCLAKGEHIPCGATP